jgi:hypothetical protein
MDTFFMMGVVLFADYAGALAKTIICSVSLASLSGPILLYSPSIKRMGMFHIAPV